MNIFKGYRHGFFKKTITYVTVLCLFIAMAGGGIASSADAKTLGSSDVDIVLTNVGSYIMAEDAAPGYDSIEGMIGLVRSGKAVSEKYKDTFYKNTVKYLDNQSWTLSETRYSEYSKLIIAMTAVGKDASAIDGHNLLNRLSDFSKIKQEGLNGPAWALLALKAHPDYQIPKDSRASEHTTEEGLIAYLLGKEITKGGWSLDSDTPDVDVTALTLMALSPYYGKRTDVTEAVDRALGWLSGVQNQKGGYPAISGVSGTETSVVNAQVICALCSLGVDPVKDARFIKGDDKEVVSRLFGYYVSADEDHGGFVRVLSDTGNDGDIDDVSTAQGMCAAAAYKRFLTDKTSLYDMSDVTITIGGPASEAATTAYKPATTDTSDNSSTAPVSTGSTGTSSTTSSSGSTTVKVKKVSLNKKKITLKTGKSYTLKATVTPSKATNKKVRWTSSNSNIARVNQYGKVTAVRSGTVTITARSKDGSNKKSSCKVVVKRATSSSSSSSSSSRRSSSSSSSSSSSTRSSYSTTSYYPSSSSSSSTSSTSSTSNTSTVTTSGSSTSGLDSSQATSDTSTLDSSGQTDSWNSSGSTYANSDSDLYDEYDEDEEDEDEDEDEDDEEYDEDEEDEEDEDDEDNKKSKKKQSDLLKIMFGLIGSGSLAGSFVVPWGGLKAKALLLAAAIRPH